MKISLKITLIYSLLFSLVLLILSASILFGLRYYLIEQSINQVYNQSDAILEKIKEIKGEFNDYNENLLFDTGESQNMIARVYDGNGKIIYSSVKNDKLRLPYLNNVGKAKKIEKDEYHLVYLNQKIEVNGRIFYIQLIKDMENEYDFLKALFMILLFVDGIGIFLSIGVGFVVTLKVLKPINYLIREVQSIKATDLNKRIKINGPDDELTRLAKTFNEMLNRIQDSFERQERFISDVSHELRTPIAVIKGYIDMLDRWGKNDKSVLQEGIDAIKKQADKMKLLTERLLLIARGDKGQIKVEKSSFCLNDIVNEVVSEAKIISPEHNIKVQSEQNIIFYGDKNLIKEMLRIFIDNSIKYTKKGGSILIKLIRDGSEVKMSIEDDGIGIPPEDIPHIFDRFYRVDKSRSKEQGGWGLGLSIAKMIIDMHDGIVFVESKVGEGTKFIIKFPQGVKADV